MVGKVGAEGWVVCKHILVFSLGFDQAGQKDRLSPFFCCNLCLKLSQGTLFAITRSLQRQKSSLTDLLISLPLGRYNRGSQATTSNYTNEYYSTFINEAN